jgi:hypothetical protein
VAGEWGGAKKDLKKAKQYLAHAIKTGDAKLESAVQELTKDIEALWHKMDSNANKTKTKS